MRNILILSLAICCTVLYLRKPSETPEEAFKRFGLNTYAVLKDVAKGER
jgi:hypothetical protein|tara:strand:- start:2478 stop:2624 length:147 start_codon:yes stop_codon:yes gene_type:complete